MGSSIGPALVNLLVGYQELKLFTNLKRLLTYFHYVDDTFGAFSKEKYCTATTFFVSSQLALCLALLCLHKRIQSLSPVSGHIRRKVQRCWRYLRTSADYLFSIFVALNLTPIAIFCKNSVSRVSKFININFTKCCLSTFNSKSKLNCL